MRRLEVDVTASTTASRDTVYGLLADGPSWPRWSPIDAFALEREGDPPPEGVSAIRVLRRGRTTGRDEILELVPDERYRYASLSGLPVRDYVGVVSLADAAGGGTTIRWQSSFHPKVPGTGWMLRRGLRKFLGQCAQGLADYAATSSASTSTSPDRQDVNES